MIILGGGHTNLLGDLLFLQWRSGSRRIFHAFRKERKKEKLDQGVINNNTGGKGKRFQVKRGSLFSRGIHRGGEKMILFSGSRKRSKGTSNGGNIR